MKAAVIHEHGGIGVLKVEDIAEPKPVANEVVVEVHSAALNHLDIWVRKGRPSQKIPMPLILGSDASGVIVEKGAAAYDVNIGDEVVLYPGLSCGRCEFCKGGEQSECESFGVIGMNSSGTFAERIAVPFENVWPKPAYLDFNEAAALTLAHLTAWRMLMNRARLKSGETVLIHGIGGGVALASLQFAKLAKALVIITSSSDEKIEKAIKMGADYGINYHLSSDVAGKVKKLTGGRGVDIVVDTVGAAAWPVDFDAVRKAGRIVLCGVTGGSACNINLQTLYWNQLTVLGSTLGSYEDFRQMLKAAASAKLKPIIDSVYPLEKASEAMAKMEGAEQFGKIVLSINQ